MQERKAPPAPPKKKINWKKFIKAIPGRIAKFFRDVVYELKKVTWPTRNELFRYTIIVLVAIAFFALILGFFDFIWIRLIKLIALA